MIEINPKGVKAWVTFTFKPHEDVASIAVAGDWNNWNPEEMRRKKDGTFYKRKQLLLGQNYGFKYLIDGNEWVHDPTAPKVANDYGSHNSLLELEGLEKV